MASDTVDAIRVADDSDESASCMASRSIPRQELGLSPHGGSSNTGASGDTSDGKMYCPHPNEEASGPASCTESCLGLRFLLLLGLLDESIREAAE